MLVSELMGRLENGESIKGIAEIIGMSDKTLRRKMQFIGFVYDNTTKEWKCKGKFTKEQLNIKIQGKMSKQGSTNVKSNSHEVISSNTDESSVTHVGNGNENKGIPTTLTANEIEDLRQMMLEWRTPNVEHNEYKSLHEQIKALKRTTRKRKTVVISEELSDRLDTLSERERFDKSDLLELALQEFLSKYE